MAGLAKKPGTPHPAALATRDCHGYLNPALDRREHATCRTFQRGDPVVTIPAERTVIGRKHPSLSGNTP